MVGMVALHPLPMGRAAHRLGRRKFRWALPSSMKCRLRVGEVKEPNGKEGKGEEQEGREEGGKVGGIGLTPLSRTLCLRPPQAPHRSKESHRNGMGDE